MFGAVLEFSLSPPPNVMQNIQKYLLSNTIHSISSFGFATAVAGTLLFTEYSPASLHVPDVLVKTTWQGLPGAPLVNNLPCSVGRWEA